jgi:Holliday junction DNA helicase RuvB
MRTPRGRVATAAAWHHLGLVAPPSAHAAADITLFDTPE